MTRSWTSALLKLSLFYLVLACVLRGPAYATKWQSLQGECSTDGETIFSPLFPQNYEYKGLCTLQATIGGSDLLQTSYETDNRSEDDVYKVVPLTPYDDIECVCINEDWSANLSVTLNANLSIGYVGGDRTDKQPPWRMQLDFVCRSPCVDINRFGDPCTGECENQWLDRDGLPCSVYENRGFCADGRFLRYTRDYYDNFIGARSANRSALDACCACGGGSGTPLSIAPFCEKVMWCVQDGIRYGCDLPSDTQCARIDLVARDHQEIYPVPAPAPVGFNLDNLPDFGWGVVGALIGIVGLSIVTASCCIANAKKREKYLQSLMKDQ